MSRLKGWACIIKRDVHAAYLAAGPAHPMVRKGACDLRCWLRAVTHRLHSRDFIPVLGYLDDLIIVPLSLLAVVKLIPPECTAESGGCGDRRWLASASPTAAL